MSDDSPKISVALVVAGDDFDTSQLSSLVGLEPTRTWFQKLEHLRDRSDLPNCEWEYKLEKLSLWSIDDAIKKVVNRFWSERRLLGSFVEENNLSTTIVLYVYNEEADPEYSLTFETMERLVELKAEFCMQLDE